MLRCNQGRIQEVDADFGLVQLQLEIYMNLFSLFFNTWNVFFQRQLLKIPIVLNLISVE